MATVPLNFVGVDGNGPSLATPTPPPNCRVLVGDELGVRSGRGSGTGQRIFAGAFCYIAAAGIVLMGLQDTAAGAAANSVQTMYSTLAPGAASIVAGNVVYGFKRAYTPPLALTATAADVQTAMRALSTIAGANITVTGTFPDFVFTFIGTLAGQPVELVEVDSNLTSDTGELVVTEMKYTTMGRPVGNGASQAQSRVRGIATIPHGKGQPISLYHDVEFNYSDGQLTPGADYFLSSTEPGRLDTVPSLTGQAPIAFAVDEFRMKILPLK